MKQSRMCRWVLIVMVVFPLWACADAARAQDWVIRQVLQDRGWHGVGGTVQVHQPTIEHSPPWVGVWERSARSDRYGDWAYVRVLINCQQWSQIPFGTLDEDHNFVLMADLIGTDPPPRWPERGTQAHRVVSAVCGLYGYREFKPLPPATPTEPDVVVR